MMNLMCNIVFSVNKLSYSININRLSAQFLNLRTFKTFLILSELVVRCELVVQIFSVKLNGMPTIPCACQGGGSPVQF